MNHVFQRLHLSEAGTNEYMNGIIGAAVLQISTSAV